MPTAISNLPKDLMEEIISRVPLKLMRVVRSTCKSWNSLANSESFTKLHVGKAKTRKGEEAMVIAMMSYELYLTRNFIIDHVDPSVEIKGHLVLPNKVRITRVIHYEGLLLCILVDVTRVIVWNPYLGQARSIHLRHSHCPREVKYALGYAEKKSCGSVKLLRFIDYFEEGPERKSFFWYEIYDFDTSIWKTLDVTPHWCISNSSNRVSLKGNTYWCVGERSSPIYKEDHIICFDFTRERFGPLLLLPDHHAYPWVTLSCVKEEKLAALFQPLLYSDEWEIEIWITTKIEAEMVSWSKFLRIRDGGSMTSLGTNFFVDEEKKIFMSFDVYRYYTAYLSVYKCKGEDEYFKKVVDMRDFGVERDKDNVSPTGTKLCSYVPSSIQIKELARGKRKRKSIVEERRFDEYMLRLAAFEKSISKGRRQRRQQG